MAIEGRPTKGVGVPCLRVGCENQKPNALRVPLFRGPRQGVGSVDRRMRIGDWNENFDALDMAMKSGEMESEIAQTGDRRLRIKEG